MPTEFLHTKYNSTNIESPSEKLRVNHPAVSKVAFIIIIIIGNNRFSTETNLPRRYWESGKAVLFL